VRDIRAELEAIAGDADFVARSGALARRWLKQGVGDEALEPILRFMEEHPGMAFGAPGPLVHFAERFHGREYAARLLASLERRPTSVTVWMLNRLINGTQNPRERRVLIDAMRRARDDVETDGEVREELNDLLAAQSSREGYDP
jgi:hypothetical protein